MSFFEVMNRFGHITLKLNRGKPKDIKNCFKISTSWKCPTEWLKVPADQVWLEEDENGRRWLYFKTR